MAEINKFLDELEARREEHVERRGMLRQFDGFRSEWATYLAECDEMGNLDRG